MKCDISTSSIDDSVTLIFWYKNDRKTAPIYSVDARSGPLNKAPHFVSEELKNRANFDINLRPAILTINPIRENDGGLYLCRVDFKWARTTSTLNNLTIIGKYLLHLFFFLFFHFLTIVLLSSFINHPVIVMIV